MHESVLAFGKAVLTPELVTGKRVLEVGALNVNGSLRAHIEALKPAFYHGIDIQAGPGVDEVVDICDVAIPDQFDLVVSTEMLEHAPDWRAAVHHMKAALKPGGRLLLTTRSAGFPLHEYPGDHWRFSVENMRAIFADCAIERLEMDPQAPGVFVMVRQLLVPVMPVTLDALQVYSMHAAATPAAPVARFETPRVPRPMFTIIHPTARPDK
jgi:SAM-dependent methyltransferase